MKAYVIEEWSKIWNLGWRLQLFYAAIGEHTKAKKILRPMKEIPPHKQPEEKIAPLKLEEPSNILIKKQVEITRKEEEIINDESRK